MAPSTPALLRPALAPATVAITLTALVAVGHQAPAEPDLVPVHHSPSATEATAGARTVGTGQERRRMVAYTVRPGDTATGIATRFHAWTAELLGRNGLTARSPLYVGQRLRVPVVPPALRAGAPTTKAKTKSPKPGPSGTAKTQRTRWHADPHRNRVARAIVATSRKYRVNPHLALAVSWQESGWHMRRTSSAGAIGAMQVLPTTGTWMTLYVGRPLALRRLADNVAAGVMLLRVLADNTSTRPARLGAYYQGLGAVRRYGLYAETERYVANVLAIKQRLDAGRPPA